MDRKQFDITKKVSQIKSDMNELKSSQFVGQDNTKLRLLPASEDSFDVQYTLSASETIDVFLIFTYGLSGGLKPWQPSAYSQLFFQLWVGNLSTPWEGFAGTINVIWVREEASQTGDTLIPQIINASGSNQTIFIKYWAITTAQNGNFFNVVQPL